MNIEEYNYDLPEKFIAQVPLKNRSDSKLLLLDKENGNIKEEIFKNIVNYFFYFINHIYRHYFVFFKLISYSVYTIKIRN